ncbi:MAG: hypothetical protein IJZ68_08785 [Bacteroidaceae bacterium]|nr:hypothetical protein [Bacteroidaceae bacterium]
MLTTELGGFVKNLETGEYDLLFTSEIGSEMLVRNRTGEAASNKNKFSGETIYDVNDIVVKSRTQRIVFGPWVEV